MSFVDDREEVLAWPRWARSLLTVLAAISFARRGDAPWSRSESRICSYLRSCFSVQVVGIWVLRGRLTLRSADTRPDAGPNRPGRLRYFHPWVLATTKRATTSRWRNSGSSVTATSSAGTAR